MISQQERSSLQLTSQTFLKSFSNVKVFGFVLDQNPGASQVIPLLNIATFLRQQNELEDSMDADFLAGLALMNARRYVQGSELIRRAKNHLIQQQHKEDSLLRAAKLELLVAEGFNQHG